MAKITTNSKGLHVTMIGYRGKYRVIIERPAPDARLITMATFKVWRTEDGRWFGDQINRYEWQPQCIGLSLIFGKATRRDVMIAARMEYENAMKIQGAKLPAPEVTP